MYSKTNMASEFDVLDGIPEKNAERVLLSV